MKSKEQKKLKKEIKALLFMVIIFSSTEICLWILEINNFMDEPLDWHNRPIVPYKINDCKKLFSDPENRGKLKAVIIGDSFPQEGFDPYYFDDYFDSHTICYNLGIYGSGIRFQSFYIQNLVIPKLNPYVIIWALSIPYDFVDIDAINEDEERNLDGEMVKYYQRDLEPSDVINDPEFALLKTSRIYKYRFLFLPNFLKEDLNEKFEYFEKKYDRGYDSQDNILKDENKNMTDVLYHDKFLEEAGDLFRDTIECMEKNNCKYIIVVNPRRYINVIYPPIYPYLNDIPNLYLLDLNGNERFNNNTIHNSNVHLNYMGARIYTNLICEKVNEIL